MKCITKEDLIRLLEISDRNLLDAHDVERLIIYYGDDWYVDGNKWIKTSENKEMAAVREKLMGR